MAKYYTYILAVWLRLDTSSTTPEMLAEVREYLEADYQISNFEVPKQSKFASRSELTILFLLQMTFEESEMNDKVPLDETIEALEDELQDYLEARYRVNYLEILDDALASNLIAIEEEPDERNDPVQQQ